MKKLKTIKQRAILGIFLLAAATLLTISGRALHSYEPLEPPQDAEYSLDILSFSDIVFTPPPEISRPFAPSRLDPLPEEYVQRLLNFDYLISRIFLVDPETILFYSDINVEEFLEADLSIDYNLDGPLVLIFHTHSTEMFSDSNPAYPMTGIMGAGQYLAEILYNNHGIKTLHYTGRFDVVDGHNQRQGSYERMEPVIRQILTDNPSIQVVIDLHRDGVGDHHPPFVTYINGTRTAQIMFFNGLSRRIRGGTPEAVPWLPNPYQTQNLNFSFRLQLAANQLYPDLTRRIYLRAFRYSLHMLPLSTLVEVGNQHNTLQDAKNAMHPLANVIAAVVA
ncbi:MAG: stage II sporulation protein P [Defluviitaleaceae bacterium]|nr:stage II sporulation protein P [Defluviitaleaceae bacterium]